MTEVWDIWDGRVFQSGLINDWAPLADRGVNLIVDLEGGLDNVIPTPYPDSLIYIYWPIEDGPLPNIQRLWALASVLAPLVKDVRMKLLSHCGAGVNRASLLNGMVLYFLLGDKSGEEIVEMVRKKRPGALTNVNFERFLLSLEKPRTPAEEAAVVPKP